MTDLNEIVGSNIKDRRLTMGVTQRELNSMIGNGGGGQVSGWETGKYLPDAYNLCELADVFGCTVDELLGRGL